MLAMSHGLAHERCLFLRRASPVAWCCLFACGFVAGLLAQTLWPRGGFELFAPVRSHVFGAPMR